MSCEQTPTNCSDRYRSRIVRFHILLWRMFAWAVALLIVIWIMILCILYYIIHTNTTTSCINHSRAYSQSLRVLLFIYCFPRLIIPRLDHASQLVEHCGVLIKTCLYVRTPRLSRCTRSDLHFIKERRRRYILNVKKMPYLPTFSRSTHMQACTRQYILYCIQIRRILLARTVFVIE